MVGWCRRRRRNGWSSTPKRSVVAAAAVDRDGSGHWVRCAGKNDGRWARCAGRNDRFGWKMWSKNPLARTPGRTPSRGFDLHICPNCLFPAPRFPLHKHNLVCQRPSSRVMRDAVIFFVVYNCPPSPRSTPARHVDALTTMTQNAIAGVVEAWYFFSLSRRWRAYREYR